MRDRYGRSEGVRGFGYDGESEHEKHRRLKSELERLRRKQLCRPRDEEFDDFEDLRPRRCRN